MQSKKQRLDFSKLQKRLQRNVGRAIEDFNMIEQGDKIMVCLSGGKDSHTMLDILRNLQRRAPVDFELVVVNLDQKQPGFPEHVLPDYLTAQQIPFHIIERDTYGVVKRIIPEGKTTCSLCSRLRRGIFYGFAKAHGMTKIALGHHRDDIVETLFLNMFYRGRLQAMPPKLLSEDSAHVVIRPLAYCAEKDIAAYAQARQFPIVPCNLCGSQPHLQRKAIKDMLKGWEKQAPGRMETIFASLQNVALSHLADTKQFDFTTLGMSNQSQERPAWLPRRKTAPHENLEDEGLAALRQA
jgi:tRNA 2-thiocytidine biosynthesis protein TtcA